MAEDPNPAGSPASAEFSPHLHDLTNLSSTSDLSNTSNLSDLDDLRKGQFSTMHVGYNRANGNSNKYPFLTAYHQQNKPVVEDFLNSSEFQALRLEPLKAVRPMREAKGGTADRGNVGAGGGVVEKKEKIFIEPNTQAQACADSGHEKPQRDQECDQVPKLRVKSIPHQSPHNLTNARYR
ncbi:uncharacterized protein EI90DRAFT_3129853 [Cantharellus anzutake]|uniref:uncharacterized protein n=1 Tax=Cantharellus anzutake TaxID=1750568 RepID=UPI0019052B7F|nr:uncharacterized protein EI90DRAFT_3129853 [Cantharellus anzutake]KAF8324412.1 hypothetical protein EI90DRAFT_3129853 [Cantharellus anzutake]